MIRSKPLRKLGCSTLAACCLFASMPGGTALAQTTADGEPPSIRVDPLAASPVDRRQVFTAEVRDDGELELVRLHHRRAGEKRYETVPMRSLGSSGFYSATLDTDPEDLRPIEYYFEARDAAGNRTVNRFAFDPYVRELRAGAVATTPSRDTREDTGGGVRWWAVALGVLAVGAIAAAASGSGGGGDSGDPVPAGDDDIPNGIPLTITLQEP